MSPVLHLLVLHLPLQHLLVLCLCVLHLIVLQGCNLYSASICQQSSFPSDHFCVAATWVAPPHGAPPYGAPPHGAPSCTASSCYAPYWAATCTVHRYANSCLSPAINYAPLQISWWIQARARGEQVVRRRTHGGTLAWVISIPSLEQEVGTITTGSHGPGHHCHRFPHLGQPWITKFGTTMSWVLHTVTSTQ